MTPFAKKMSATYSNSVENLGRVFSRGENAENSASCYPVFAHRDASSRVMSSVTYPQNPQRY
jgi:hypothetical protein